MCLQLLFSERNNQFLCLMKDDTDICFHFHQIYSTYIDIQILVKSQILMGQTYLNTYVHVSGIWGLVLTLWLHV